MLSDCFFFILHSSVLLHEEFTRKSHQRGPFRLNFSWQDLSLYQQSRLPVDWSALEATDATGDLFLSNFLSPPRSHNTGSSSKRLNQMVSSVVCFPLKWIPIEFVNTAFPRWFYIGNSWFSLLWGIEGSQLLKRRTPRFHALPSSSPLYSFSNEGNVPLHFGLTSKDSALTVHLYCGFSLLDQT